MYIFMLICTYANMYMHIYICYTYQMSLRNHHRIARLAPGTLAVQGVAVRRLHPAMVPRSREAPDDARGARSRAPAHVELGVRHGHRWGGGGKWWFS